MKKILYVATVDLHIRTFHLPYLKLLHDNGYEVHVATNGDERFPYCDVKHQICIERNPLKINNLKAIKQLKTIIDKEEFDIIHCHTPMGSVVTRLAAKRARKENGTRVIYTAHGFHFYKGAPLLNWILFYPVEWYLAKYTDTLITINKEDYKRANRNFGKRCKDIQYIPGVGIDTKRFDIKMTKENKEYFKKSLGLEKDDYILSFVARLDKNKNQIFLIDAMEKLVKADSNIHLLLVGPDELNGYYQNITKEKKLEKNIHFLGKREDIPQILAITDICVSSSLREGLPVNIMEAISSGIPIVALKTRGVGDLIKNEENGFIVDNEINFINKVNILKNNKDIYDTMYTNTLKSINNFDIINLIKRYQSIYYIENNKETAK